MQFAMSVIGVLSTALAASIMKMDAYSWILQKAGSPPARANTDAGASLITALIKRHYEAIITAVLAASTNNPAAHL